MGQIDRIATFRGYPVDSGVSETKKSGLPQWVASLKAVEIYDEDTEQWVDWSKYEETEITGYFVLFDKSGKPTLTCQQVSKAVNWDGVSVLELGTTNYSKTLVQFRVEENTYEGNTRLQVSWIDHADAEPGRSITKLEPDALKKIDAKYAAALRKLSGGPKPKSVPTKPPTPKSAKAALKAEMDEKAAKKQAIDKKAKTTTPTVPTPPKPKSGKKDACTLNDAWETVYGVKPEEMSDKDLENKWYEIINKYGDEDTLSPVEWAVVRDEVIAEIS